MTSLTPLLWSASLALAQAPPPTVIATRNEREVRGTAGAYLGYEDALESDGRFLLSPSPDGVRVEASYAWRWSSSEGDQQQGREDRVVHVDPATRRYRDRCDLDDLDALEPTALSTWLWVPTGLEPGQVVPILDEQARVEAVEAVEVAGATWQAVRLQAAGTGTRDDDYGQLQTTWTETWWFDSETGTFLRSQYEEHATGRVEGLAGAFVLTERVARMPESHRGLLDAPATPPTRSSGSGSRSGGSDFGETLCTAVCTLFPVPLIAAWYLRRHLLRRPRERVSVRGLGAVDLVELREPVELRGVQPGGEHPLAPVLADLAARTLAAGGRVQVARRGSEVLGLAAVERQAWPLPGGTREQRVGTVVTAHPRLLQALVYNLDLHTWFALAEGGVSSPDRFRLVESWSVLRLDQPQPQRWDPALVRRMKEVDHVAVVALLGAEGEFGAAEWLEAQLSAGDMGFVAVVDGQVVGCGLCGLHGALGRLHGLVVHPDHRGKGVGAELLRARLDALALLGAERVVVEIATANLASMHLAREAGFQPVGKLVVESRLAAVGPGQVGRR